MAIDPYVPDRPEDAARASLTIPPPAAWRTGRPGELRPGQPTGSLLGTPGPDGGYALTLAGRFHERLEVVAPETRHDAEAVGAALAMRRAGMFGRAPVSSDVEMAFTLFGWLGGGPAELVEWRRLAAAGAGHAYAKVRRLVDGIPDALLRGPAGAAAELLPRWREVHTGG